MGWKRRVPGVVATGIALLATGFWVYWGAAEMYHEGWWGAWYNRIFYLIPGGIFLVMTLLALRWPRMASWLLGLIGIGFSIFWWGEDLVDHHRIDWRDFPVFLMLGGAVFVMALLFHMEGCYRAQRQSDGWSPPAQWWRRHLTTLLTLGMCIVIFAGISAYYLPIVLTREDDGYRGIRTIQGNDVTLVWAPLGPGWNWKQSWGGYPSWRMLALYGAAPVGMERKERSAAQADMDTTGLCRYLNEDGTALLDTPQNIWRMPTVDELVRSLVHHGENAGCIWNGDIGFVTCDQQPDKETPLWAPDLAPIYMWAADEYDNHFAYFISYNGAVQRMVKQGGNPRHGYRCVKPPA
jgi:hypothetical protein